MKKTQRSYSLFLNHRSVTIHNLLTRMRTWETLNDSHCTAYEIDGAVYRTCHDIVRANELLVVQLKVCVW